MKRISYIKFESDSLIKPLWLDELFKFSFTLLGITFLSSISVLFVANNTKLLMSTFIIICFISFIILSIISIHDIIINSTKIYPDGIIEIKKQKIKISKIKSIEVSQKKAFIGFLSKLILTTIDDKRYVISISEPHEFTKELLAFNNKITVAKSDN